MVVAAVRARRVGVPPARRPGRQHGDARRRRPARAASSAPARSRRTRRSCRSRAGSRCGSPAAASCSAAIDVEGRAGHAGIRRSIRTQGGAVNAIEKMALLLDGAAAAATRSGRCARGTPTCRRPIACRRSIHGRRVDRLLPRALPARVPHRVPARPGRRDGATARASSASSGLDRARRGADPWLREHLPRVCGCRRRAAVRDRGGRPDRAGRCWAPEATSAARRLGGLETGTTGRRSRSRRASPRSVSGRATSTARTPPTSTCRSPTSSPAPRRIALAAMRFAGGLRRQTPAAAPPRHGRHPRGRRRAAGARSSPSAVRTSQSATPRPWQQRAAHVGPDDRPVPAAANASAPSRPCRRALDHAAERRGAGAEVRRPAWFSKRRDHGPRWRSSHRDAAEQPRPSSRRVSRSTRPAPGSRSSSRS